MCLWFACLGLHKHDNDCDHAPATRGLTLPVSPPAAGATKSPPPHAAHRNGYNGYGHYGNNGAYSAAPLQTAAGAEASNDVWKGPAAAVARDAPERAFAYTGAAETTVKQNAPYYCYYYYYEPAHKEDAMDQRYATATAAIDHERY